MSTTVVVTTKPCMVCKQSGEVTVDRDAYASYLFGGALVHQAFPNLSADEREMLISGTHGKCWNDLFGDDEDEDEDEECSGYTTVTDHNCGEPDCVVEKCDDCGRAQSSCMPGVAITE